MGTQFSVMSFLKKCAAAAVAKKKIHQKLWKGRKEGELTESDAILVLARHREVENTL